MLECGFAEFLYLGLPLSFKAQCLPQIKEELSMAGCHVVSQTQGYHLLCIWVAWLNSREWGCCKDYVFVLECRFAEFLYRGYPCLSKLNVSLKLRRGCVWLGAMLLHRHGAIVWYAFGVAWLNSRGVGLL